jgi:AbrB family looped-hinge helix DNA binding protein
MSIVTVSRNGWVVIPSELRAKYHWESGDQINVVDYGGVISLVPILGNLEEEGLGALRVRGRSLLKRLKAKGRAAE